MELIEIRTFFGDFFLMDNDLQWDNDDALKV